MIDQPDHLRGRSYEFHQRAMQSALIADASLEVSR